MKKQIEIIRFCKRQKAKRLYKQINNFNRMNLSLDSPIMSENILMLQIDRAIKQQYSVNRIMDISAEDFDDCVNFIKRMEYHYLGNIIR